MKEREGVGGDETNNLSNPNKNQENYGHELGSRSGQEQVNRVHTRTVHAGITLLFAGGAVLASQLDVMGGVDCGRGSVIFGGSLVGSGTALTIKEVVCSMIKRQ
jgi:hypothetical protein